MAIGLVADEGVVFIEKEITEGLYQAEQSGTAAIEVLSDGLELKESRELLTRNNRTGTVETVASLLGTKSSTGTIPVELKAAGVEGAVPESGVLWEAMLGGVRSSATATSKIAGHTASRLEIEDADIGKYKVGDSIRIKESEFAGEDHVSAITAVDTTGGAAFIDLLVTRAAGAFTNSVKIGAFTTFFHQSGAPSLSITNYLGGKKRQKALGVRPTSAELGNFSTGVLADVNFAVEGLSYGDREIGNPLFAAIFDSDNGVTPPPILNSKIYQNGVEVIVNSLAITLTNTLAFLSSTGSPNGRVNSRITKFETGGTFNPYMQDDNITVFDNFNCNKPFSVFARTQVEDCDNAGVFKDGIAFYIPNARNSDLGVGNEDGVLTDEIAFTGHKTLGNDQFFISFH